MSSKSVLAGILAGAAIGAALGILFAPAKGTETRRKIAEKGSDLAGNIKDKYHDLSESISEKFDSAKEKLSGIMHEVKGRGHSESSAMKNDIRDPRPVNS